MSNSLVNGATISVGKIGNIDGSSLLIDRISFCKCIKLVINLKFMIKVSFSGIPLKVTFLKLINYLKIILKIFYNKY